MYVLKIEFSLWHLYLLLALSLLYGLGLSFLYFKKTQNYKKLKAELDRNDAQLQALELSEIEHNLNPHLFKNVLNSIQSHAYQTYHSIDSLSNVLDYILYESKKKYVTPMQEISFALSLIEIYRIKLSPLFELVIKKNIDEHEPLLHQRLMAPLLCIDFIENAFKHADIQSHDSFISITFSFKNNNFNLTVANKISKKAPLKKDRDGFGGKILEKRLNVIYKENFKLDRFVEDDVYIAHFKLDLLGHKTKMLAAR